MARLKLLALTLLVGSAFALGAGGALAVGPGTPQDSPSREACGRAIGRQAEKGVVADSGAKSTVDDDFVPSPTNCDHFWQDEGLIGGGYPSGPKD
jgi:hypothetical protein